MNGTSTRDSLVLTDRRQIRVKLRRPGAANLLPAKTQVATQVSLRNPLLFAHIVTGEIIPELWMLKRYDFQNAVPTVKETVGDLAVITPRRRRGVPS